MHILDFEHFAVPPSGSTGTRHIEMFSCLRKYDFKIVSAHRVEASRAKKPRHPDFLYVKVIASTRNDFARILNWITYAISATLVGLFRPRVDVIYASSPHLLVGLTGLVVAKVRRLPFVLEVRDLWPRILVEMGGFRETSPVYRILLWMESLLYRQADAIIVMAPGSIRHITDLGVSAEKITYIPNGANPICIETLPPRETLRARYGFSRRTAVYAGAHGPANGLGELLRTVARVGDIGIDVVLVGAGVEKASLERLSEELQLTNLRFLPPVPHTEISSLLFAADIGLHILRDVPLFRYGISPNKVFDYMASGLPIISNSPGIVSEILHEAGAGWGTEPGLLEVGLRLAAGASEQELVEIGSKGKRWIQENQSRSQMAERLEGILDRVTINGATS